MITGAVNQTSVIINEPVNTSQGMSYLHRVCNVLVMVQAFVRAQKLSNGNHCASVLNRHDCDRLTMQPTPTA